MSSLPKITVVTPSFNQGHYLEATFKSVLAQEYPNLEWFVVDGGSKDNSVDLIKKYEKHFAWWISEKDRNHPHALNKGYERATGEIFCFVNSDDTLRPGALHYVAKKFEQPGTDWVVGWATYFEDSGDEWEYSVKKTQRPIDWFLHNPIPQISSFWRTEAYKKAGPFTEKFLWGFDYEYWMRLYFVAGYRPTVVKRCLGEFRLQPNSKTVSKPENYAPDFKGIHEEYSKYLTAHERKLWRREAKKEQGEVKVMKAWQALKGEGKKAGRAKALEAVKHQFTSLDAWRVMYCALRGR
jgi:glycosyltransferase involved in cell wall biosynthesis